MLSSNCKRKHKTLTIKEKHEILQRLDQGENQKTLANEYGIGRATIYNINKNRAKIEAFMSVATSAPEKRQTLKKGENSEMEDALYSWFIEERRQQKSISGVMLVSKAKYFYKNITGKDDFAASKGWLDRFKNRYGIRLTNTTDENFSTNHSSDVQNFIGKFLQNIKELQLCPSQVYSVNEFVLCWRGLPIKEHITFLPCANASGHHKLKLLVIGKSENSNTFESVNLPVHYFGQKSACMTRDLFKKWFDIYFVSEVKNWLKEHNLPPKALLLIGSSPSHQSLEELTTGDKCITAIFLPPNTGNFLQPMNENLIQSVKKHYKNNLLMTAVAAAKKQAIERTFKEFNLNAMVFLLTQSWDLLTESKIISSWKTVWPDILKLTNFIELEEDDFDDDDLIIQNSENLLTIAKETQTSVEVLQEWYEGHADIETTYCFDEEIINQTSSMSALENDDNKEALIGTVSANEAVKNFEVCLQWAEENNYSSSEILLLRRMRDMALCQSYELTLSNPM